MTNAVSETLVEPVAGERPVRRAVAVVVVGLSVAAGAAAITLLSRIMRSVTAVGGSCVDGGPYVLAQPCPSGTGTALLFVFPCALLCLVGGLWGASVLEAPLAIWLGWPALFLTLGWNFVEDGFDSPMGEGVAVGYVVCGVVFVLMGAGPLLFWAWNAKGNRRGTRARARVLETLPAAKAGAGAADSRDGAPAPCGRRSRGLGHVGRRPARSAGLPARLGRADRRRIHRGQGGHAAWGAGPVTEPEPEQPRRATGWWLYYLLAAVLGVYGGLQLFQWATT